MGLFNADFYRFLAFGFVAGALLVGVTVGSPLTSDIANGMVPVAEAAAR